MEREREKERERIHDFLATVLSQPFESSHEPRATERTSFISSECPRNCVWKSERINFDERRSNARAWKMRQKTMRERLTVLTAKRYKISRTKNKNTRSFMVFLTVSGILSAQHYLRMLHSFTIRSRKTWVTVKWDTHWKPHWRTVDPDEAIIVSGFTKSPQETYSQKKKHIRR